MKKLTFSFMLLALCAFATNTFAQDDFSKGSNYYLIYLDDVSAAKIPAANVTKDYRVDDTNNFLYVWSNTYTALTPSGPNWNGEVGTFISMSVGTVGWSGFGFSGPVAKDLTGVTSDYTLHLAMKSSNTASHIVGMDGPGGLSARLCIGSTAFVDGANTYQPYTNFTRDNKWHLIEIPMTAFFNLGLRYPQAVPANANVVYFLSGGTSGVSIAIDAIFVYKKSATAVNTVNSDLDMIQTAKTITILGTKSPIELYSITGARIKTTNEEILGIDDVQKGIYIVRSGSFNRKIEIK